MALIKCDECGSAVSDKAFSCPSCGNPFGELKAKNKIVTFAAFKYSFGTIAKLIKLILFGIFVLWVLILSKCNPTRSSINSREVESVQIPVSSPGFDSNPETRSQIKPLVDAAVEAGSVFDKNELRQLTEAAEGCELTCLPSGCAIGATACNVENKWSIRPFQWNDDGRIAYVITHTESGYCGSGGCTDNLIIQEKTEWKVLAAIFGQIEELKTKTNGVSDIALSRKSSAKTRFAWNNIEYRQAN